MLARRRLCASENTCFGSGQCAESLSQGEPGSAHVQLELLAHLHRGPNKPWHTASTQRTLMWKQYRMWRVSRNALRVPFSPRGECVMRWQKPPFSNSAFMNYWLLRDGGLNITASWNNSPALARSLPRWLAPLLPSPLLSASSVAKLDTQSRCSQCRSRSETKKPKDPLFSYKKSSFHFFFASFKLFFFKNSLHIISDKCLSTQTATHHITWQQLNAFPQEGNRKMCWPRLAEV